MQVLVESRFEGDAVCRLAHQRLAYTGKLRVHPRDGASLARQLEVELEDLTVDLHLRITGDIHVVFSADPRKTPRNVRELRQFASFRVGSEHYIRGQQPPTIAKTSSPLL